MAYYKKFVKSNSQLEDFLYSIGLIPDLFNIILEYATKHGIERNDDYTDYNCFSKLVMREYDDIAILYVRDKPKMYINKQFNIMCDSKFNLVLKNEINDYFDFKVEDILTAYKKQIVKNIEKKRDSYFEFDFETSKKKHKDTLIRMGMINNLFSYRHRQFSCDYLYALYKSGISDSEDAETNLSMTELRTILSQSGYSTSGTKSQLQFMIEFYGLKNENIFDSLVKNKYPILEPAKIFLKKIASNTIDSIIQSMEKNYTYKEFKSAVQECIGYELSKNILHIKSQNSTLFIDYIKSVDSNIPNDICAYISYIMEYICEEIIELSCDITCSDGKRHIREKDIITAIKKNKEFGFLYKK